MLWCALHLPDLALQVFTRGDTDDTPLAVLGPRPRQRVAGACPAALAGGVQMLAGLPQDIGRLLRAARRGKVQLEVDVPALKSFGDQLDRAASRLTMAIVTAALIVGSSIVMTVDRGGGVATLGLLGFVGAVLCGLWVLVSVWRGGR